MMFYHGCHEKAWQKTLDQGFLLHERHVYDDDGNICKEYNPAPCTYLATEKREAQEYGPILLRVKYDPYEHPHQNNYCEGCWQVRVYEPIPLTRVMIWDGERWRKVV